MLGQLAFACACVALVAVNNLAWRQGEMAARARRVASSFTRCAPDPEGFEDDAASVRVFAARVVEASPYAHSPPSPHNRDTLRSHAIVSTILSSSPSQV